MRKQFKVRKYKGIRVGDTIWPIRNASDGVIDILGIKGRKVTQIILNDLDYAGNAFIYVKGKHGAEQGMYINLTTNDITKSYWAAR